MYRKKKIFDKISRNILGIRILKTRLSNNYSQGIEIKSLKLILKCPSRERIPFFFLVHQWSWALIKTKLRKWLASPGTCRFCLTDLTWWIQVLHCMCTDWKTTAASIFPWKVLVEVVKMIVHVRKVCQIIIIEISVWVLTTL